ncbi:hypothetical protein MRY87_09890 [bacterium]|nr:hypothetical protein [bacterium]
MNPSQQSARAALLFTALTMPTCTTVPEPSTRTLSDTEPFPLDQQAQLQHEKYGELLRQINQIPGRELADLFQVEQDPSGRAQIELAGVAPGILAYDLKRAALGESLGDIHVVEKTLLDLVSFRLNQRYPLLAMTIHEELPPFERDEIERPANEFEQQRNIQLAELLTQALTEKEFSEDHFTNLTTEEVATEIERLLDQDRYPRQDITPKALLLWGLQAHFGLHSDPSDTQAIENTRTLLKTAVAATLLPEEADIDRDRLLIETLLAAHQLPVGSFAEYRESLEHYASQRRLPGQPIRGRTISPELSAALKDFGQKF